MKDFLSDKKAVLAGAVSAVVLTVMRIVQLISCTEYPSLLYAQGCEVFNTMFSVMLVLSAVVISICAYFDAKNANISYAADLSAKSCNVFGVVMIIAGAVWILPVINDFSYGSVGFTTITSLACCIAYLIGGMSMMASAKIVPAHCISAIFIIINYLIVAVKFYLSSPIITSMPQKLMMMMFYVLTVLFWINAGRFLCGAEKKLTRTALIASGYFCSASAVAYIISCYVLLAVDSEKWAVIAQNSPETLPDLEIMITALVPALLAAVVQFSKKRKATGEPELAASENVPVNTAAENADTEDTENGTESNETQDDMQDDTQD